MTTEISKNEEKVEVWCTQRCLEEKGLVQYFWLKGLHMF